MSVGFEPVPNWRSCFWHPRLRLFLVVYVDDFKLSGPTSNLREHWGLIRKGLKTDVHHSVGLFLGCNHVHIEKTLPDTGAKVRGIEYDMSNFLRSCVDRYKELTGVTLMSKATTPFLSEPTKPDFSQSQHGPTSDISPDDALNLILGHP